VEIVLDNAENVSSAILGAFLLTIMAFNASSNVSI
jgi:hypothetical protein